MRNLIKKILKENINNDPDWSFVNFEPSEELFYNATEVNNGYHWSIDNFNDWKNLYDGLTYFRGVKLIWEINPYMPQAEHWFNQYLKKAGNLNVLLTYDKENVYGWFDTMSNAYNKNNNLVPKPII